jgi:hypothetical protein
VVEIAGIFTNMIFHDALIQRPDATESHFNPSTERQTIWTKKAREQIGRLARRFTGS